MNMVTLLVGYRFIIGINLVPYAPTYRDVGRSRTESEYCSRMWAVHPVILLEAKNSVKNSLGIANAFRTRAA